MAIKIAELQTSNFLEDIEEEQQINILGGGEILLIHGKLVKTQNPPLTLPDGSTVIKYYGEDGSLLGKEYTRIDENGFTLVTLQDADGKPIKPTGGLFPEGTFW